MASSGKKGKKNKGTVISLQSFLANGEPQVGVTQVAKKVRSYGFESDEEDGAQLQVFQLPTAPRASRIFEDDSIPHKPPFLANLSNLPFDGNEDDIIDFLYPVVPKSLRLPREDGDTGRVRGFGFVEFETRDDLIHIISLPDPQIKNRRVRIEISSENEQQQNYRRNAGDRNRRPFEGFKGSENRESTNWRRDNEASDGDRDNGPRAGGRNYDRGGFNRDRPPRDDSQEKGSWRSGDRPTYDRSPRRSSAFGSDRYRDQGERRDGSTNRRNDDPPMERPKLNLKPRTLPLPEIAKAPLEKDLEKKNTEDLDTTAPKVTRQTGASAGSVFGSAKPVDTAAREKEIEERLEKIRLRERMRQEQDQKETETDISEKSSEINLNKDDKESRNTAISSWRRKDETVDSNRKYSPDRKSTQRSASDLHEDDRPRDLNRDNQNRDRTDKYDRSDRYSKDKPNSRENKPRDDSKHKPAEQRPKKPTPNNNQRTDPVLQTSNKYIGLLDEYISD